MKTALTAFLVAAALGLAACDPDSSDGVGAVCEPAAFTTANPTGAEDYCIEFYTAFCDRAFSDCTVELGMTAYFANVTECIDEVVLSCTSTSWSTTGLNPACAASCLRTVRTADCSLFDGPEPIACDAATGTVGASPPPPPPTLPACTQTITVGTIQDTIVSTDPLYITPSRTYCLSLTAGQYVTLTTSAPTSGTPIGDTVLYLLSPTGAQLAVNDDYLGLYSQITGYSVSTSGTYRVVVRGYDVYDYDLGSYRLTVSTY